MNKNINSNIPIPDPKATCNIDSNLTVTEGVESESLQVNTVTALEGDVTASSSVDVSGIGSLQGSLSVGGTTTLGTSTTCGQNISLGSGTVTGLSDPQNPQDALNYNYALGVQPDVYQSFSSQYGPHYEWYANENLDWTALFDYSYGTKNAHNMFNIDTIMFNLLLPGIYHVSIDFNKADAWNNLGGTMMLQLIGFEIDGPGYNTVTIAYGNNYTQFVVGYGSASICNSLGAMFSVTEAQINGSVSLQLLCGSTSIILSYFNYRIIRYPFY